MHPLQRVLAAADGLVLIGDSSQDRFPGFSYHAYTQAGKPFHCLDLGGLTESRGPTRGGVVYTRVEDLPAERPDLAEAWVKPRRAAEAVEVAHEAGCRRVWFSFQTGHPSAVERARELGMEVVEIGRCPVYYLEGAPAICRAHAALVRLTGTRSRPPQTDPTADRREIG